MRKGTIYFIRFKAMGLVKIGFTRKVKKRAEALEYDFGEMDVLGLITDAYMTDEAAMHRRFENLRVQPSEAGGSYEMFRMNGELARFITEQTDTEAGRQLTNHLKKRRWRVGRNKRRITNDEAFNIRQEYDAAPSKPDLQALADQYRISLRYIRNLLEGGNHKRAGGPIQKRLPDSY